MLFYFLIGIRYRIIKIFYDLISLLPFDIHLTCVFSPSQIHNSTERSVVLYSVNLMSSGRYRCEVSAEAPSFQTVSDHSDMLVVGEEQIRVN